MCFLQAIIEDIQEAGWSIKKARENERISDLDLRHIFEKVDINQDCYVNRMVRFVTDCLQSFKRTAAIASKLRDFIKDIKKFI